MSVIVSLVFVVGVLAALFSNRDLFSPAKFFLFSFLVFHVGAFDGRRAPELWVLILLVLLVGIAAVLFETLDAPRAPLSRAARCDSHCTGESRFYFLWIWVLTVPAILSQAFMIQTFGGIEGYIGALGLRVIEWRGLGWAKTLIATITVLNLIYFAVGLTRRRTRFWWAGYAVHFLIVLVMGALSGSRSGILNVLAMQLFTYHYIKREVKLRTALVIAVALVTSGLVLGVVRDGFKLDDSGITTGLADSEQLLSIPTLKYGVTPLELLVESGPLKLAYGSTLLSLFTNAVPRDWWPEKPDTGGVFFTKEYTADEWEGASNLTPTLLGEAVINFGWILGIPLFLVIYPLLMYVVVGLYQRTLARLRRGPDATAAANFVIYLLWMWTVVALMTGEVTNVVLTLVLTGLIPAYVARALAGTPRRRNPMRRMRLVE